MKEVTARVKLMELKQMVVVGAGLMGRGIAHCGALGGYDATLVDVSDELLAKAVDVISSTMNKGVQLGKLSREDMQAALARLHTSTDLAAAARTADMAIEAVPEDMDLKLRVFRLLDEASSPSAILATNTSAKSITEIAAATRRQDRVIGMHFFNPAYIMKLVEVVKGLETSDETCLAAEQVARQMGKEPVRINEFPGFAAARINAMIGNEAFYMLMEGVGSAEDIDKAMKLGLNHPMGPFELGDLVGWDTRLSVLEYLHQTLGEKYRPCPLLVKYVKAGRLGRKTGRGVYDYSQDA